MVTYIKSTVRIIVTQAHSFFYGKIDLIKEQKVKIVSDPMVNAMNASHYRKERLSGLWLLIDLWKALLACSPFSSNVTGMHRW